MGVGGLLEVPVLSGERLRGQSLVRTKPSEKRSAARSEATSIRSSKLARSVVTRLRSVTNTTRASPNELVRMTRSIVASLFGSLHSPLLAIVVSTLY